MRNRRARGPSLPQVFACARAARDGRLALYAAIGLFLVVPAAAAQTGVAIRTGEDRPLSPAEATFPVAEPHLSTHPEDSNQLFVSALVIKAARPYYDFDCVLFRSLDGGKSWTHAELGFGICGNTWSTVLPDRSALFVALTAPDGIAQYRADMRVYRSNDGGLAWSSPPHEFGPGFDYPKILYDGVHGDVYVVGSRAVRVNGRIRHSIVVGRSADGGRSFPDSIHLTPSENAYEAQVPVALSDGSLVVPFTEHDQGVGGAPLPARRSWLVVSRDRTATFSEPRLIAEGCGGGGTGWPYLAVDGTEGRYRDRLYWLCARQGLAGVWLRHSDDVGETWSEFVRVDQEAERTSAAAYALAVNRDGTIGVMWLRRLEDPEPCSWLFFSASVDGGNSFMQPVKVSTEPSCPARDQRNAAAHAHRPRAGGDYNGLAAAADGVFHLVWADARDGIYRLRHATALVEPNR